MGLKLIEDIEILNETDTINNIQEQDNQYCSCNFNISCIFRKIIKIYR